MWQAQSAGGTDHDNPQLWLEQHNATAHARQGLKWGMGSAHEKETLALWCRLNSELCSGKYHTSKVKLWFFFLAKTDFSFWFLPYLAWGEGGSICVIAC